MKTTHHLLLSGSVQGVGFRHYTKDCADKLGVTGWVRNLSDRRVEAVIQGCPEVLEQLRQRLLRGPTAASVSGVEVQVVESPQTMKEFIVKEDGEKPCLKK